MAFTGCDMTTNRNQTSTNKSSVTDKERVITAFESLDKLDGYTISSSVDYSFNVIGKSEVSISDETVYVRDNVNDLCSISKKDSSGLENKYIGEMGNSGEIKYYQNAGLESWTSIHFNVNTLPYEVIKAGLEKDNTTVAKLSDNKYTCTGDLSDFQIYDSKLMGSISPSVKIVFEITLNKDGNLSIIKMDTDSISHDKTMIDLLTFGTYEIDVSTEYKEVQLPAGISN